LGRLDRSGVPEAALMLEKEEDRRARPSTAAFIDDVEMDESEGSYEDAGAEADTVGDGSDMFHGGGVVGV
jgi:hypothetical protein